MPDSKDDNYLFIFHMSYSLFWGFSRIILCNLPSYLYQYYRNLLDGTITKLMNSKASNLNTTSSKSEQAQNIFMRLVQACEGISYRELGRRTDTHPETVRRYMQGQSPSAVFLSNLTRSLGISGDWLLTGHGPMKCSQIKSNALSQADPAELLRVVATAFSDMSRLMDQIERTLSDVKKPVELDSKTSNAATSRPKAKKLAPKSSSIDHQSVKLALTKDDHDNLKCSIEPKPKNSVDEKTEMQATDSARGGKSLQRIRDALAKRTA